MSYLESLCTVNKGGVKRINHEMLQLPHTKIADGIFRIKFSNGSMDISLRDQYPFKAPMVSIEGFREIKFNIGDAFFYSYYDTDHELEMLSIDSWKPNIKIQHIIDELEKYNSLISIFEKKPIAPLEKISDI